MSCDAEGNDDVRLLRDDDRVVAIDETKRGGDPDQTVKQPGLRPQGRGGGGHSVSVRCRASVPSPCRSVSFCCRLTV
jgi:hypothetical protein